MATSIQMNILTSSNSYDILYPETDYNLLQNKPTIPEFPLQASNLNAKISSDILHQQVYIGNGNDYSFISFSSGNGQCFHIYSVSTTPITINNTTGQIYFYYFRVNGFGMGVFKTNDGTRYYGAMNGLVLSGFEISSSGYIMRNYLNMKNIQYNFVINNYIIS